MKSFIRSTIKSAVFGFLEVPRFVKRGITVVVDIGFVFTAVLFGLYLRVGPYELSTYIDGSFFFAIVVTALTTIALWAKFGFYRAVVRYIDLKALTNIVYGVLLSAIAFVAIGYSFGVTMPRSLPIIYFILLTLFSGSSRLFIRSLVYSRNANLKAPVVIYGAGDEGHQLALTLQHGSEYVPVAFVDDDKRYHKLSVGGITVYGVTLLEELIKEHSVKKVLLAVPEAGPSRRKSILNRLEKYAVEVLTIPGSADLVSGKVHIDTLKRVSIEDLLGREPVKPIDSLFRRCIESKSVMVTGAGGSIGSELCRQIIRQWPEQIVLVEVSEYALYVVEGELQTLAANLALDVSIIPILASVQDKQALKKIVQTFSIHTIYHAAAYKHVPLVEYNIISGIKNNVFGTLNCAQVAKECEVENFVLVSTDKAVRPTNVMGASKRLSELAVQALAQQTSKTSFCMVRFGNVLGSSGSVVPLFRKQIANDGPITITHPEITRYFMTIPEAAQLVIQAGAMGKDGEVFVLDMGESVKIRDMAEKMVHLSGLTVRDENTPDGDIEIVYTGLRPGEKLYEELLIGDDVLGTAHARIMRAQEQFLSWQEFEALLAKLVKAIDEENVAEIQAIMLAAPLEFNPSSEISDLVWAKQSNPLSLLGSQGEVA